MEVPPISALLKNYIRYLLVSLGCLHLIGGPLALFQMYAWGGMLISYSQKTGLRQAVRDTFSGEKPCPMCRRIAAAEQKSAAEEKAPAAPGQRETRLQDLAPQMIPLDLVFLKEPTGRSYSPASTVTSAGSPGRGADAPPVPPPCVV